LNCLSSFAEGAISLRVLRFFSRRLYEYTVFLPKRKSFLLRIADIFYTIGVRKIKGEAMKSVGIKKLYYSISEVSKITDLEQYVLRYWESEFEQLKPSKNRAGNRVYTNKDIKLILHIKHLLREERYTIEGAKQVLKNWTPEHEGVQVPIDFGNEPIETAPPPTPAETAAKKEIDDRMKEDLKEIKSVLEEVLVKLQ
jgi:DNA-binding transcriptional MerR regulator